MSRTRLLQSQVASFQLQDDVAVGVETRPGTGQTERNLPEVVRYTCQLIGAGNLSATIGSPQFHAEYRRRSFDTSGRPQHEDRFVRCQEQRIAVAPGQELYLA